MAKDFGVSPITNTIYYGTVNKILYHIPIHRLRACDEVQGEER